MLDFTPQIILQENYVGIIYNLLKSILVMYNQLKSILVMYNKWKSILIMYNLFYLIWNN